MPKLYESNTISLCAETMLLIPATGIHGSMVLPAINPTNHVLKDL